jgi:hypothetical protein
MSEESSAVLPELTPEQHLTEEQKQWRESERKALEARVRQELRAENDKFRKELEEKLSEQNKEMLQKVIADFKKDNTPPTPEEIQKMLDQEFLEFKGKVRLNGSMEEFTIGELSSEAERKFLRIVKEKALPKMADFGKILLELTAGETNESKLLILWEAVDPLADAMHEAVALVLTYSLGREVKAQVVRDNVSLNRQLIILRAQADANRVRDFFSFGSRLMTK